MQTIDQPECVSWMSVCVCVNYAWRSVLPRLLLSCDTCVHYYMFGSNFFNAHSFWLPLDRSAHTPWLKLQLHSLRFWRFWKLVTRTVLCAAQRFNKLTAALHTNNIWILFNLSSRKLRFFQLRPLNKSVTKRIKERSISLPVYVWWTIL